MNAVDEVAAPSDVELIEIEVILESGYPKVPRQMMRSRSTDILRSITIREVDVLAVE